MMAAKETRYATIDTDGYWVAPTPRAEVQRIMARGRQVYLRFGRLPAGGSYNYRDGRREQGVSVWRGYILGDTCVVDLREVDGLSAVFIIGERAGSIYTVTGTEVGRGSDGEPLLDPETCRARRVRVAKIVLLLTDEGDELHGGEDAVEAV